MECGQTSAHLVQNKEQVATIFTPWMPGSQPSCLHTHVLTTRHCQKRNILSSAPSTMRVTAYHVDALESLSGSSLHAYMRTHTMTVQDCPDLCPYPSPSLKIRSLWNKGTSIFPMNIVANLDTGTHTHMYMNNHVHSALQGTERERERNEERKKYYTIQQPQVPVRVT